MRSIPQALFWETVQRGRWTLPGFLLLGLIVPTSIYAIVNNRELDQQLSPMITLHFTFIQLMLVIFSVGIVSAQGSPSRLFCSPLSTPAIVGWHFLFGGLLLGLEIGLSSWGLNLFFGLAWPILGPTLFAIVSWSALQFLICSAQRSMRGALFAAIPFIALAGWFQSRYGSPFSMPTHYWTHVTLADFVILISIVGLAYFGSLRIVARHRCGESATSLKAWTWLNEVWDNYELRSRERSIPFSSKLMAQTWFEWNRKGAALPTLVAIGLCFGGIGWVVSNFAEHDWLRNFKELHIGLLVIGGLLSALGAASGFMLGMGSVASRTSESLEEIVGQSNEFDMGPFQATLPINSLDFAKANLNTALKSLSIAWCLWALPFLICLLVCFIAHDPPKSIFPNGISYWYLPLTLLGPWIGLTNIASIGLSGRLTRLWPLIILAIFVAVVVDSSLKEAGFMSFLEFLRRSAWTLLTAGITVGTLLTLVAAAYRGSIPKDWAWKASLAAIAIALGGFALSPVAVTIWVSGAIVAIASLTVLPFATIPLAVEWNRHR